MEDILRSGSVISRSKDETIHCLTIIGQIEGHYLLGDGQKLIDFANGHHFFGFHRQEDGWVYREWAPGAENLFVMMKL